MMTRDEARKFLATFDGYPPTDQQLDVIMAGSDPAVVIAGAGAGKTKTMALRVVYQVAIGNVDPNEVLGLTFTKKAANELSTRVATMLSKVANVPPLSRPTISTYNSFAASIASDYGLLVGLDPSSRLINDAERYDIIHDLVRHWPNKINADSKVPQITANVMALAARIGDNQISTDDVRGALAEYRGHIGEWDMRGAGDIRDSLSKLDYRFDLLDIVDAYHELKKANRWTEFSDQVSTASAVLQAHPQIAERIRSRYSLILLDEYQDTSANQASFLAQLFAGTNVTAVGDPNQAIYAWRGASAAALSDFVRTFGGSKKVSQYSLSTAFRNKEEILAVANQISQPLRAASLDVVIEPLSAGVGGGGTVEYRLTELADEAFAAIAEDIDAFRTEHAADNDGRGPSIAVLCRGRAEFAPMAKALESRGIPYLEHGNYRASSAPECMTVRALLRASAHPGRGDVLPRLLAYLNVGTADIAAIGRRANLDRNHPLSSIEALSDLESMDLTEAGRERLETIVSWIEQISHARYRRLDDIVRRAISLLGLDVEVGASSRRGGPARSALATLVSMASGYSDQVEGGSLEAFLDWLDSIDDNEHGDSAESALADMNLSGLSEAELEDPSRVTIMTMHAAKGLEWDYVAIPKTNARGFDLAHQRSRDQWVKNVTILPTWIRADARDVPQWDWRSSSDAKEANESYLAWMDSEVTEAENFERRRLAYVAMTRPRTRLFLAGWWYADLASAIKASESSRETLVGESRLLHGVDVPRTRAWEKPVYSGEVQVEPESAMWPAEVNFGRSNLDEAVEMIENAPLRDWDDIAAQVPEAMRHMVDSIHALRDESRTGPSLERLTAGGVVAMVEDPREFALDYLRPVPTEPRIQARIGSQIHEYIASHFGAPRSADLIDIGGDDDQVLGLDLDDPAIERLITNFARCRFASATPVAIETPADLLLAGVPLRGTIDAVMSEGDSVRIVDWKTGRRPRADLLDARSLQLQVYRLAWAHRTGMRLDDIEATFVYLGEDDDAKATFDVEKLSAEEITTRVESGLRATGLA